MVFIVKLLLIGNSEYCASYHLSYHLPLTNSNPNPNFSQTYRHSGRAEQIKKYIS